VADVSADVKAGPVGERDAAGSALKTGFLAFVGRSAAPTVLAASNAISPAPAATTTFMTPSPADFLFSVTNDSKQAANNCCQIETNTQKPVRVHMAGCRGYLGVLA